MPPSGSTRRRRRADIALPDQDRLSHARRRAESVVWLHFHARSGPWRSAGTIFGAGSRGTRPKLPQRRERAATDPLLARQWERTRRSPIHARDATTMSTLTSRLAHRTQAARAARTHAARAAGALVGALLLIATLAS